MTRERPISECLDCQTHDLTAAFDRREFIRRTAGGVLVASAAAPLFAQDRQDKKGAKQPRVSKPETHVAAFYKTLTAEQKKAFAYPFDHPLRQKVDNNWFITKTRIASLTGEQQELVFDIVKGLHSPEYADTVMRQIETDNGKNGFKKCSVAVFGKPGAGAFEFVFTGRHVTRRCDGDSVKGAAFGGPIFYGHAAGTFNEKPHHPGNAYWFQAKRANEVFQALDGKQRAVALRSDPRKERGTKTVALSGSKRVGIPVGDLSKDQKGLVRKVMDDLLAPFRRADRDETMKLVEKGGFDKVHLSFYKNLDVGNDGVWDVWQLQGPAMLWYFRGHPHVHTWVHVRAPKKRRSI